MLIRKARKGEVKMLQNLNDELFIDNSKYDPDLKLDWAQSEAGRKYFNKILNNPDAVCLIAEDKGKPIGYISAAPKEMDYRLSKYIEIENMGVSPDYRSKGIGTQLIKKCLEIAKKKGYQRVCVASYFDNIKAVKFYKKNSFKEISLGLEMKI